MPNGIQFAQILTMSVLKQSRWISWVTLSLLVILFSGYLPATGVGMALATVLLPKVKALKFYKSHPQWCSIILTALISIMFFVLLTVLTLSVSTSFKDVAMSGSSAQPVKSEKKPNGNGANKNLHSVSVKEVTNEVEKMGESIHWLAITIPYSEIKLKKSIFQEGERLMGSFLNRVRQFLTNLPGLLLLFYMMFLGFFFTLIEGEYFSRLIKESGFLNEQQFELAKEAYLRGCRSVFIGSLVCGLVQATLLVLLMIVFGVPSLFLGFLVTFFLSFLPVIGTVPIILVVSLFIALDLSLSSGLVFLVLGGFLIGVSDNIVRPIAMRHAGNVHPLLGALSIVGSISLMGLPGLFLGPILANVLWSLSRINVSKN